MFGLHTFIRDGFVSLVGSDVKVPVKILRDTAAYDSFLVDSVLPLSSSSDTGDVILSRGIGMTVLPVLLHKVVLGCELVHSEVAVGVRPPLPIAGVHLILGNGSAGSRVWGDTLSSPGAPPSMAEDVAEGHDQLSGVPPACVVTRSRSKAEPEPEGRDCDVALGIPSLSDFPLSVSSEELLHEQQSDPYLKDVLSGVLSDLEVSSAAGGYLIHNGLLFRKWVPLGDDFVCDTAYQLVVPAKFCLAVLKVAHDESGHFGTRKTYLGILKHFFWPRMKKDVAAYIRTCHVCQLAGKPNQVIKPAPLQPIPAVSPN